MAQRLRITYSNPNYHRDGDELTLTERITAPDFDDIDIDETKNGVTTVHAKWSDTDGNHGGEAYFTGVLWYRLDDLTAPWGDADAAE